MIYGEACEPLFCLFVFKAHNEHFKMINTWNTIAPGPLSREVSWWSKALRDDDDDDDDAEGIIIIKDIWEC